MKKTILLLFLMTTLSQNLLGQLQTIGSEEYGRIFDLTYDQNIPNKVYALTLNTHLLVSEDNGENFEILYSLPAADGIRLENLRINKQGEKLTFSVFNGQSNNNHIIIFDIASSSVEKKIFLPNATDFAWVNAYSFYETDYNYLLVDTNWREGSANYGKTFYTSDGGLSWTEVYYTENNDTVFLWNVAISPYNPEQIFLMRGEGQTNTDGGIFISNNSGQDWTEKLAGITTKPIAFHPTNPNEILLGSFIPANSQPQNLYKSTDAGYTWNEIPVSWTPGIQNCINVIKYNLNNPNEVIVLEENEILVSNDGAATFSAYAYPIDNVHSYYYGLNVSYNPFNSQELFISGNYHPLKSTDGGTTVTWLKNPFFSSTDKVVYSEINDAENLYYGVQFGYVHRDMVTNTEFPHEILPLNYVSIDPGTTLFADHFTTGRVYIFKTGFMGSTLEFSNDHGTTRNSLYTTYLNFFTAMANIPNTTNEIIAAFTDIDVLQVELVKFDFTDPNNPVSSLINLPQNGVIHGIVIDENNPEIITITSNQKLYRTMDGGNSWIQLNSGLDVLAADDGIFDLQRNPLNADQWSIATSKGIFLSEDNGESWTLQMPAIVHSIAFSTKTNGHIIASTLNDANISHFTIYASSNGGNNWQTISNEQLEYIGALTADYKFSNEAVEIFIGSRDLGLLRYTLEFETLTIPDNSLNEQIILYPVPTNETLYSKAINDQVGTLTIYDIHGSVIIQTHTNKPIPVGNLSPGTYITKIVIGDKTIFKRFLKN